MSETKPKTEKKETKPETEAAEETVCETPEAEAEQQAPETEAPARDFEKEIAALEEKIKENDDKYLRLAAEYDNYRRRSAQERASLYGDAVSDAVKELLPILDDLSRAVGYTEADKVTEGLAIIEKTAENAMKKLGVSAFGEVGETFDASLHNAVMHEEDESLGESVITDVFQKGYRKGDKIIRYAMVKVAN